MLTFGAIVTLIAGLVCLIDSSADFINAREWKRRAIFAAVYLTMFSGFYTALVLVP